MVVEQTDETLASCSPTNHLLTDSYTLTSSRESYHQRQYVTLSGNCQLTGITYFPHAWAAAGGEERADAPGGFGQRTRLSSAANGQGATTARGKAGSTMLSMSSLSKVLAGPHPMVDTFCNRLMALIPHHQPMCFGPVGLQWRRSGMRQLASGVLTTGASSGATDPASPNDLPNFPEFVANDTSRRRPHPANLRLGISVRPFIPA